ncbi:MAG: AmmeMemoRadiSam system protein B [Burkholderiaceae bacterium]
MMETPKPAIRPAAVAGTFYPAHPEALRDTVGALLADARVPRLPGETKALIAPHAGYVYSGPIAASAYAALGAARGRIRRVVLLGPAHRVPVRGLALPGADRFATPLGEVEVDAAATTALRDLPQVTESPAAHALEHALEVHLPFLQTVLGDFRLVPLAVGGAAPEEVAQVLERVWGGAETLIVVSSDLSHYLPYADAREVDAATLATMLALEPTIDHRQACGATPVNGLLHVARRRGMRPILIDVRNSGDTAGDRARVVGYAALAFCESRTEAAHRADETGVVLTTVARGAIARELGLPARAHAPAAFLNEPGASFVTLRKRGELRGCIGTLRAQRPLGADVAHNARAAAFADPRFAPLARVEFDAIRIEVSLLSEPVPLAVAGEREVIAALRPHVDGVVFELGERRSTFLPQVWQTLPDPRRFLAQLKRKAGLPEDFWSDAVRVWRYTVRKWSEDEVLA